MKCLITGASSGIGKEMADYLASLGYDLFLVATDSKKLKELFKDNRELYNEIFRTKKDLCLYEKYITNKIDCDEFRKEIIEAGMSIVGTSPDERLVEIVELENHPWFVAVQFHPELKSRPNKPHPLFKGFIKASLGDN